MRIIQLQTQQISYFQLQMLQSSKDKNQTQQDLSTGLEASDYDKAIKQRNQNCNRFYKGQQVPWFADLTHFKMYGVGIYLFFSFLKHATIFFFVMTLFSVVPIVFNIVKGNTLRNSASGLNVYLTRTSLGSYRYSIMNYSNSYDLSISYKVLNVSFDILACVILLIFCLYWEKKSRKIAQHISKEIKLQSNLTVQAIVFPENAKESEMQDFMSKFAHVTEVVAARDYTKQIELSKSIYELQLSIRQLQFEDKNKHQAQISEINEQIKQLYLELDSVSTREHKTTKFYIQFETPQQRNRVLSSFYTYQRLCTCCKQIPEQMLLHNQKVEIAACNTEPSGILWENAHFTWRLRIPRVLLQLLIVLAFIVGGFIFISFLNILVPPIQTDVDTSNISYTQIKAATNSTIVQAWCVQNFQLPSQNSSSPYFQTCYYYWRLYLNSIIISISISVIILILCEVIKKIVYTLASFQRYTTKAQESVTILTNLFIMQFLTTTLITFLMQANIFGLSVLNFLSTLVTSNDLQNNINSISQYHDLTTGWYKDIGYQIWFNIFIQIFLPQVFQPFLFYIRECFSSCRAKKQLIHQNAVKKLQCPDFQIEDFYSNILVIIATGVIFGGGIQLMMVVVFLCLLVRYFYLRFLFTRFCKVPLNYNEILNERVVLILKVILLLRCLISLYMYGADDVFAMQKSTFMQWASSLSVPVFSSVFIVLSRALLTWYYTIFVILFILCFIFKELIFGIVNKLKKCCKKSQNNLTSKQDSSKNELNDNTIKSTTIIVGIEDSLSSWGSNQDDTIKSQRKQLKSYRMQNNPSYSQILIIMKLKLKKDVQKIFNFTRG